MWEEQWVTVWYSLPVNIPVSRILQQYMALLVQDMTQAAGFYEN